jgi:hypothetical protein
MKFQVGDKVKFLNEKGGGIVTKIITSAMVNVMVEDGFEIPTLTSDLIKVDPKGKVESMFDEDFSVPGQQFPVRGPDQENDKQGTGTREPGTGNQENAEPDRQSPLANYSFRAKNAPGIYLAFVPHDQKWLVTGTVEVYLINHTPYDILYSFFLENDKQIIGKDYDVIFSGNKILVDAVEREKILEWRRGVVQFIFYHEGPDRIFMPVNSDFEIMAARFNNEGNYGYSQFFEEKNLLISLASLSAMKTISAKDDLPQGGEDTAKTKSIEVKHPSLIGKHQTGPKEAVVDLHIEELDDNPQKLDPSKILRIQLDYFKRCIESAVKENFHKITFIHGVGNGVLKSAIIDKLKEYEKAETHLASIAKFGVGAIDVIIKPYR